MKFNVEIALDADVIADAALGLTHEEAIELVLKIDLMHADTGFTEALIRRLVTSLKRDVNAGFDEVDLPFINWRKVPDAGEQS